MTYRVNVLRDSTLVSFLLLPYGDSQRIDVDGVVIIDIFKYHNHRYDLQAFFYQNKVICSSRSFGSKKELYGAIQKLLEQYL